MSNSYIKLFRSMLDWEWYQDKNTKILFLHMLLKANWKEGRFKGEIIPRGAFVSSISKLAAETGLSVDEVRTAIKNLVSTEEITKKSLSKFTIFTVNRYCEYQDGLKEETEELPSSSQAVPKENPSSSQAVYKQETQQNQAFYEEARKESPSNSQAFSKESPSSSQALPNNRRNKERNKGRRK